ncbi:ABC transporter ATP-binding protein [Paracoccus sp. 1_MG-2023]|uniref:ABC transporter ATP-binding protein n=1 Tax=unclassified Paracoccus (in: a-proteobacteria) TaxID=2688777 RepID=UPI001C09A7A8|nr:MULTISPECIES: ABC transporter ATP-binding protein [unclassified Paracoccus (in: a-proteobacteria)]MBU2959191.1 ABC transporter ATP-binding protein/permease [Paracoccus sp. C2R09]MDO6670072.1 ABC transporter ATP-binding protein [Paracoccus sp. 1_MG-2023]
MTGAMDMTDVPGQGTGAPTWRDRLLRHRWALLGILICQMGQVTASLLLPSFSADIIDIGIGGEDPAAIWHYGRLMGIAAAAQLALSGTAVFLGAFVAYRIGRDLRADVFAKVQGLALSQLQGFTVGSLITRCTNDVLQVQSMLIMALTMIVVAPIMGVGSAIMAVRQDARLSWLLLVAVPVLALLIGFLTVRAVPLYQRMQTQLDRVNGILREQIEGIRVIRAFLQQPREAGRFAQANADLTGTGIHAGRLMAMIMPSLTAVMQLTSVALIWAGAGRVRTGELEIGALIAFLSYVALILIGVMMMGLMIVMLPRALVSARRIAELLQSPVEVGPPSDPTPLPPRGDGLWLRLNRVGFGYPGAEAMVLEDITFEVGPAETLGIIGATGSGKSTIVNLIARLDDPVTGRVTLGDVDLRQVAPDDLALHIGYVPQKAYLFSGTVADSLRLGNPGADEATLWKALEIAQAADFIRAMPDGLMSPVAQGGANFSGGQRQRLAIARALVGGADLYLFDDSFSALDQATDRRLRAALRAGVGHAATVIVSQRVASIRDADRILVIDKGRMVGLAPHEALMQTCPVYAETVRSQLGSRGDAA